MDWWRAPLAELVGGRRVVLVGAPAVTWTPLVAVVRDLGAVDVLVVGTGGMGVGPAPDATTVVVESAGHGDLMADMRADVRAIGEPPPHIVDVLDEFDPDRSALVFGNFLAEAPDIAGRPLVAHRRPAWVALEDKTSLREVLERADVVQSRSAVVPIGDAGRVWRGFDDGAGTVWAADASEGFHGGAALTRWVTDDAEASAVTAELARHCATVRVMPFLDGIPTSVHGIVLPDGVAVLRPVELVTLRRGHELRYCGCATFWDPPEAVREEMRAAARRVGEVLRADVDFRGAFTLDGVASADGFRPTELNPRFGAGLNVITRGLGDVPLTLVLDLVVAGVPLPMSCRELEELLVTAADAQRSGGTWQLHVPTPEPVDGRDACYDGARWRWAADGEPADALVSAGAGFSRAAFVAERTPVGASAGPRSAAFWRFAEHELGIVSGALTPAPDLTRHL